MSIKTTCGRQEKEKVVWKVAIMWAKGENKRRRTQKEKEKRRREEEKRRGKVRRCKEVYYRTVCRPVQQPVE